MSRNSCINSSRAVSIFFLPEFWRTTLWCVATQILCLFTVALNDGQIGQTSNSVGLVPAERGCPGQNFRAELLRGTPTRAALLLRVWEVRSFCRPVLWKRVATMLVARKLITWSSSGGKSGRLSHSTQENGNAGRILFDATPRT